MIEHISSKENKKIKGFEKRISDKASFLTDLNIDHLKNQFKGLKRNYFHFDTKDGFMDALLMGRPYLHEDFYLEEIRSEHADLRDHLVSVQHENRDFKECFLLLIDGIFDCVDEIDLQQDVIEKNLINLFTRQKKLKIMRIRGMLFLVFKELKKISFEIYHTIDSLKFIFNKIRKSKKEIEDFERRFDDLNSCKSKNTPKEGSEALYGRSVFARAIKYELGIKKVETKPIA